MSLINLKLEFVADGVQITGEGRRAVETFMSLRAMLQLAGLVGAQVPGNLTCTIRGLTE